MKFEDFLIEKSLIEYSTDYTVTDDSVPNEKIATIFKIDDVTYAIQLYKTNKKGLWKVAIGSVPNTYIKLWKVHPSHMRTIMGTALKIIADAFDTVPANLLAGIAVRLPDSAKPSHAKIAEMVIKTKYASTMKFVNVVPSANEKVKEIYILAARKTANIAKVFRGKEFKGYDESMPDNAVSQDDLADAEAKRPLKLNRVSRKPFEYKGVAVPLDSDIADKIIGVEDPKIITSHKREVTKKFGMPIGLPERIVSNLLGSNETIDDKSFVEMLIYFGTYQDSASYEKLVDANDEDPTNSANAKLLILSGRYFIEGNIKRIFPAAQGDDGIKFLKKLGMTNFYDIGPERVKATNSFALFNFADEKLSKKTVLDIRKKFDVIAKNYEDSILNKDAEVHAIESMKAATFKYPDMGTLYVPSIWDIMENESFAIFFKTLHDSRKLDPFEKEYNEKGGTYLNDGAAPQVLKVFEDLLKELTKKNSVYGISLEDVDIKVTKYFIKFIEATIDKIKVKMKEKHPDYWDIHKIFYSYGESTDLQAKFELPIQVSTEETLEDGIDFPLYDEFKGKSVASILGFGGSSLPMSVVEKGDQMLYRVHNSDLFQELNKTSGSALYKYTESDYDPMNSTLRNVLTYPDRNITEIRGIVLALRLIDAFETVKPLEEDIIVFRGSGYPGLTDEVTMKSVFVDPGFLSTSSNIGTVLNFGGGSGTRFMILVPKGARVIAANGSSSYPHEKEIILPPFSVLKPLRMAIGKSADGYRARFAEVLYVGNGMVSYKEKLLEKFKNYLEKEGHPLDTDYKDDSVLLL